MWTSLTELYLNVTATTNGAPYTANVIENGTVIASVQGVTGSVATIALFVPNLWTPNSPFLYNITVALASGDSVDSYFGVRTFTLGVDDNNVTRPLLNGQFIFLSGVLDQGFWPDGIYRAPTDEALAYDLQAVKSFGMNLIRKHQKVEPARWYTWADK